MSNRSSSTGTRGANPRNSARGKPIGRPPTGRAAQLDTQRAEIERRLFAAGQRYEAANKAGKYDEARKAYADGQALHRAWLQNINERKSMPNVAPPTLPQVPRVPQSRQPANKAHLTAADALRLLMTLLPIVALGTAIGRGAQESMRGQGGGGGGGGGGGSRSY